MSITIESGLFTHMVLQRNSRNLSEARITGKVKGTGLTEMTVNVAKGGKPMKLKSPSLGPITKGKFNVVLSGLPAGGPYDITLIAKAKNKAVASAVAKDVLVGDVWLLGGQSNMEGCGKLKDKGKERPTVRAFYMDDHWDVACDPIHELGISVDQVHFDISPELQKGERRTVKGVGPGRMFGQVMNLFTGVPQGLIACAHGGTSMAQWDPKKKKSGSKSLYGAMLRRFEKNGASIAGMIWYQGESEAGGPPAKAYTKNMVAFVKAVRKDTGHEDLPFAMVQIGRHTDRTPDNYEGWNLVQDQQRLMRTKIDNLVTVPSVDMTLDDGIHISGRDQPRIGQRLAQAMAWLKYGAKAGKMPLVIEGLSLEPHDDHHVIRVSVDNVEGELKCGVRPMGFTIRKKGETMPAIFDITLDKSDILIHTGWEPKAFTSAELHYGYGSDPRCNITDEHDRGLPVFGPMKIPKIAK